MQSSASEEGCYQASYPSYLWDKVPCKAVTNPRVHPVARQGTSSFAGLAGNGNDWVIKEPAALFLEVRGEFSGVTGVTSETGVGVAAFGGGGILGPNEYSLQLNTNLTGTTAACAGHSGCTVWTQFIYATDFPTRGQAGVFMESWLLGWGFGACPSGFQPDGVGDCVINSPITPAPNKPITSLGGLELLANVKTGGNLQLCFADLSQSSTLFTVVAKDIVDIAAVWNEAEFNVVGDAGGSRAQFNPGSSITVQIEAFDGLDNPPLPLCIANAGSTGETNNLNLGGCTVSPFPRKHKINFTETN